MADKLIASNELRSRAQELLKTGKMPNLDELLQAIGETRKKYAPQITEARTQARPEGIQLQVPKSESEAESNPVETGLKAFTGAIRQQ
jgi:hypothetical protein